MSLDDQPQRLKCIKSTKLLVMLAFRAASDNSPASRVHNYNDVERK